MSEAMSNGEESNPPEFICPISLELMKDPVVVVETGQIYDRESIETWFRTNSVFTDPLTGRTIQNPTLTPVPALRNLIEQSRTRVVSESLNWEALKRRTGRATSDEKSDWARRRKQVRIQIFKNPESYMFKRISKRFKIAFIGPSGAGKTSLIGRMMNGDFDPRTRTTIGCDTVSIGVKLGESLTMLEVWDTAGEERFMNTVVPLQLRGSHLVCLVYDLTRPIVSLRDSEMWLKSTRESFSVSTIFLLGNKSDCIDSEQEWDNALDIGQAFADKHELMFFATSAKTGSEVESVLIEITRTLRATSQGQEREEAISLHHRTESLDSVERSSSSKCCKK